VAGGTAPLSFQWLRDGRAVAGATTQVYELPSAGAADNGAQFQVFVSNPYGSVISNVATLTVKLVYPPVPTISSPIVGTLYEAGETIEFSGSATDPQDGFLAASAYTWAVDFHDGTTIVPVLAPTSGTTSGSFTIPTTGDPSTDVFYRISLTAVDAEGLTQTTYRDVAPFTSTLTVATNPAGIPVSIDGQPGTAPDSSASVVGMSRLIEVPTTQILGGTIFQFTGWSDGYASTQRVVTTPAAAADFLALYQDVGVVPLVSVVGVREKIRKGLVQRFIVGFSGALDPASAQNPAAYWLVLPGRDHRFGTRDDRSIRVRAASYDAATNTVTLRPRGALSSRMAIQVVVSGSTSSAAVRDVWSRLIDGDLDGQPGGNDVATLSLAKAKVRK
jgi:hypothetical protein